MKKPDETDREENDDGVRVGTALAWYLRLLVNQEVDRGIKPAIFCRMSGLHPSRISRLRKSAEGTGLEFLPGFARYFGRSEGKILDEAMAWWNIRGRQFALEEQKRKHDQDRSDIDRRARRTESSERLILIPSHLRTPGDEVKKK